VEIRIMANICPICQKDDMIQRVETLVSAGQSSGTFSGPTVAATFSDGKLRPAGGYTTLSGSTSSNLAKLLEPPSSPPEPKGYGCWWILLAYPVIPILGAFFALPFMIPGTIIMVLGTTPENGGSLNALGVIGAVLMAIGGCIGYYLCIRYFIRKDRKKKASMAQNYSEAKPKWEKAMQRWKRLYYCNRDGIVYDPESGDSCNPATVNDFVYKQS
jgi:hypothetical protein